MSDANSLAGVLGFCVALVTLGYLVWDSIKKRRKLRLDESAIVTTNALQLVEQLRLQVKDARDEVTGLRGQLNEANRRADDVSVKLTSTQELADEMAESLANAQAEVRVLRGQVKYLTDELDRRGSCPDSGGKT